MALGKRRRRSIRRIDPVAAMKVAAWIYGSLAIVWSVALAVVWWALRIVGVTDRVEESIKNTTGLDEFKFDSFEIGAAVVLLAVVFTVVSTAVTFFGCFIYNLVADINGGIQLTILEEVPVSTKAAKAGASTKSARSTNRSDTDAVHLKDGVLLDHSESSDSPSKTANAGRVEKARRASVASTSAQIVTARTADEARYLADQERSTNHKSADLDLTQELDLNYLSHNFDGGYLDNPESSTVVHASDSSKANSSNPPEKIDTNPGEKRTRRR